MVEHPKEVAKKDASSLPKEPNLWVWLFLPSLFAIGVLSLSGRFIPSLIGWGNVSGNNMMMDEFGSLSALFSGLALVGIIYTIVLLRYDREVLQHEVRKSFAELASQLEAIRAALRIERDWGELAVRPLIGLRQFKFVQSYSSSMEFENVGAAVTDAHVTVVNTETEGDVEVKAFPRGAWPTGATKELVTFNEPTDTLTIDFRYKMSNGRAGLRRFRVDIKLQRHTLIAEEN